MHHSRGTESVRCSHIFCQEFSVSLWHGFDNFNPERAFVPWAHGFVRIEMRRFLRKSAQIRQLT
ncbi:MAG: hypothetical protein GY758_04445 [Fuerstiella sp.]|nr:hypothetical protein [Fuerstiella sp.]MCP4510189.1 hypothetical protein [Fuerstiella sp.]